MIERFKKREEDFIEASLKAKRPLVGYLCLRMPPELIEAAGAVPLRLIPRKGFDINFLGNVRPDGCSFCRMLPAIMREWYYPRLSAIIGGTCCDQMRRIMDTLKKDLEIPVFLFGAPRTWETDERYFVNEMKTAFYNLTDTLKLSFSDDILIERIEVRNRLRNKIQTLRNARQLPNSILHMISATPLPPGNILDLLEIGVDENHGDKEKIPLMLTGSIPGVWELGEIEAAGAEVVADATCMGDRAFANMVDLETEPFLGMYRAYVSENLCPHRRPVVPLIEHIKKLAQERQVRGIIYLTLKYCHPWGLNATRMRSELDGIPFLPIDDDLTSPAIGSFRTRVGAFVEMLQAKSMV